MQAMEKLNRIGESFHGVGKGGLGVLKWQQEYPEEVLNPFKARLRSLELKSLGRWFGGGFIACARLLSYNLASEITWLDNYSA